MTEYDPVLVAGPATPPVTLQEVKLHLRRVFGNEVYTDEDAILTIYLNAAVDHLDGARGWLGRAIVAQTWSQQFDMFLPMLPLGLSPVSSITSVTYIDANGDEQTVPPEDYDLVNKESDPVLRFDDDFDFPVTTEERPALKVTFLGGFGDASAVPGSIKVAILMMVGDMYYNRSGKTESGVIDNPIVRRLLAPHRRGWAA